MISAKKIFHLLLAATKTLKEKGSYSDLTQDTIFERGPLFSISGQPSPTQTFSKNAALELNTQAPYQLGQRILLLKVALLFSRILKS